MIYSNEMNKANAILISVPKDVIKCRPLSGSHWLLSEFGESLLSKCNVKVEEDGWPYGPILPRGEMLKRFLEPNRDSLPQKLHSSDLSIDSDLTSAWVLHDKSNERRIHGTSLQDKYLRPPHACLFVYQTNRKLSLWENPIWYYMKIYVIVWDSTQYIYRPTVYRRIRLVKR